MCLCLRALAAPQPADEFRRHYNQAMRLYEARQFDESIDEFEAAFAIKQLPRLLYNLGRAHFQLGHAQKALEAYRRFLELEPDPPPEIKAKVQENMAQAQDMLDAAERMRAAQAQRPAPAPVAVPPPPLPGKPGPFMINARVGPAIPLAISTQNGIMNATSDPTEVAVGLEFGFALNAARSVYLLFPPQVQIVNVTNALGSGTTAFFMVPLALQIDIPIRAAPGLYLYPRVTAGYAASVTSVPGATGFQGGVGIPEFGLKYVILRRVNVGVEPFSLPILFNAQGVALFYRVMFHLGVNL